MRWYKELDIDNLHACIRRLRWRGSRLDVAAGLMSSLIVAHPFPNANHRTSLFLARLYLESVGSRWPVYNLQGRGAERFFRDTHPFFKDSKYLLQLIRHRELVRVAHAAGYSHLRIGPGSEVAIQPRDFASSAAELRARHQARCAKLLRDLAGNEGRTFLEEPNRRTLREFVAWYRG
ncbi:MAG: hypothetical protein LC620_04080 [Halobacteriales archaeon]|nr:hypothetical protein [Halobacteriales archaeon]